MTALHPSGTIRVSPRVHGRIALVSHNDTRWRTEPRKREGAGPGALRDEPNTVACLAGATLRACGSASFRIGACTVVVSCF